VSSNPSAIQNSRTLVVVGGGAAGFFCAANAAQMNPSLKIILLEKTNKLLSKVRISGGGRCNVTHALFDIVEMSKRYPRGQHFVRKAFHHFFTKDTISWYEKRGVKLKAEKDGRMFPVSDSSDSIIRCLMNEANTHGIEIRLNAEVKHIESSADIWKLTLDDGKILNADFVCIAAGGYPKSSMFEWLKQLGHTIAEPVPSLFTFNLAPHAGQNKHPITELMGVSVEKGKIKIAGSKLAEEGPILITHWGLSGPAVLRLSAWGARELSSKQYHFTAHINWTPDFSEIKEKLQELRTSARTSKVVNQNITALPNRLWSFLVAESGIHHDLRFADLPAKLENALVRNLTDYVVEVKGKTTFKEEFVTAGGIQLSEVDPNTMMSRKHPHLFFAGEVLDVDGITGGFNFQHAWTSGWIAAKTIASLA